MLDTIVKVVLFLLSVLVPLGLYIYIHTSKVSESLNAGVVVSALSIEDKEGELTLRGHLWIAESQNVAEVNAPKGLILISHGFSSRARSLQRYAAALARDGYVVAGLNHDDIKGLKSEILNNDPLVARSRHLSLLLDTVRESEHLASFSNLPVGFVGYSMGSFGVLSAMGVAVNFDTQPEYCKSQLVGESQQSQNVSLCNPRITQRIARLINESIPATQLATEQRFLGAVLLAPAYLELLDFDSVNAAADRILMISGENDSYIDYKSVVSLADNSSQSLSHHILNDAGHFVYLERCPPLLGVFSEICQDPVKIERVPIQTAITQEIVSFFNIGLTSRL